MTETSCDKRGHIMSPVSPRCVVCGVFSSQMMLVTREVHEALTARLAEAEAELDCYRSSNRTMATELSERRERLASAEAALQDSEARNRTSLEVIAAREQHVESQRVELDRLRGLLRQVVIAFENNPVDATSDKRMRLVPMMQAWVDETKAALEDLS